MQGAKVTQINKQDLKEAISNVRRQGYRRALGEARVLMALNTIEHKIRTDPQLTQDDRVQLLGDAERVAALAVE